MNQSSLVKSAVEKFMYDKSIVVYSQDTNVDDEGWATESTDEGRTIKGNVQFSLGEEVRKKYGLDREYEVYITTSAPLSMGEVAEYGGIQFRLDKVLVRESHNFAVGSRVR